MGAASSRLKSPYLVFKTLLVARLQRVAYHSGLLLVLQPLPVLHVTLHIRVGRLVTIDGQEIARHNNLGNEQ